VQIGKTRTIMVAVKAQDGSTIKSYSVIITVAPASKVATLKGLSTSVGTLSPAFAASTTSYKISLAKGVTSINFTPTATESHATVKVDGKTVVSGNASSAIALQAGITKNIVVEVTAQNGTAKKSYTIAITAAK
jgi:hypothetical protein